MCTAHGCDIEMEATQKRTGGGWTRHSKNVVAPLKFSITFKHLQLYHLHHLHRLSWYVLICLGLPWSAWKYLEVPKSIMQYLEVPWRTLKYLEVPWITLNYFEVPWATLKYLKVLWSFAVTKKKPQLKPLSGEISTFIYRKTSPRAKRHKPSLLITSLSILTYQ